MKDRGTLSPTGTLIRKAEAAWSNFVQTRVDKLSPAVREQLGFVDGPALNKPANLVYGVEDTPPTQVKWFSAVQQVAILSIYMIYPLILARQAGLQTGEIINILQFGCVVLGVGDPVASIPARARRQPASGAIGFQRDLSCLVDGSGQGRRHALGVGDDDCRRHFGDGSFTRLAAVARVRSAGIGWAHRILHWKPYRSCSVSHVAC